MPAWEFCSRQLAHPSKDPSAMTGEAQGRDWQGVIPERALPLKGSPTSIVGLTKAD